MAPPRGLSLPVKNPKHIVPDVPWPVQTLIKFDQPVWSLQGDLWLKKVVLAIFGKISATLAAYGAPQRPSRTRENAQTHCPMRVLAGSNLDQG